MSSTFQHSPQPTADALARRVNRLHGQARLAPSEIAIGVVIGRASEYFDFFVFGIACVLVFPAVFFPFASQLDGM